ncbi:iron-containing alcohol dehydrogenase [Trichococcus shcherbakoviae]|uniref:Iron-containing alcohol dehydrogenase n=1 Tax=Trichococcus shcherbakoviae subsp. psychrophilus TaxID=2585775 RepID=A0A5C5EB53_9LACT|nr:iron-containing alcohol dehydrogenase [Trichococcus shcherbakoviae]TNV70018.1 iron-containing alcohol dehydrogenase [Trichococcus shcherbakoviae subsp. psychrophilus]
MVPSTEIMDFEFYNPVRIAFGRDQVKKIDKFVPKDAKVLITYGGGSAKRSGTFDRVVEALAEREWGEFGGIPANPVFEYLMDAVEKIKTEAYTFLIAVGGGSVIDGTKFIAAASLFEGDPIDIFASGVGKGLPVEKAMPFGTVLTIPATSSEMNPITVVSFEELQAKVSIKNENLFPEFSILEPELTYTLPKRQLANGLSDSFVHVMENYLTYPVGAKLQDRWSEGILHTFIEIGQEVLVDEEIDYNTRANFMWTVTNGFNGFTASGVPGDWSSHALGYEITALNGTDHARTLSVILPATMKVRKKEKWDKLLQYAERVWGATEGDDEARIDFGIHKTEEFFRSLEMPTRFSEIGIEETDIDYMVEQLEVHKRDRLSERADQTLDISRKIYEMAL